MTTPKFDFSKLDISTIDPDRIDMGTGAQDCALIASTFERGCHSTPTEAAIFATLTRSLQNNKTLADACASSLETYLKAPQEAADASVEQATALSAQSGGATGGGGGDATPTDHILQSLNMGSQQSATHGQGFGSKMLDWAKDCIPCDLRLMAFLELHPSFDLLAAMEAQILAQLKLLSDVSAMLGDFSMYGDLCDLLNLLSFMCIPDLQRIIATLMAMFMLQVPSLDGLIGMLQALIVPLFAPILMAITSLLDQFSVLVTNPLECVIDAIRQQLKKLEFETPRFQTEIDLPEEALDQVAGSLKQLNAMVTRAVEQIQNKLNFYIDQVKAMLGELGAGDAAYLQLKIEGLATIRMISFVVAVIAALSRGQLSCSATGKPAELSEIDNFFQTFLNPSAPFNLWVDDDGQIHLDEDMADIVSPPHLVEPALSEVGNVFQFEGKDLLTADRLDPAVATAVEEIASDLSETASIVIPCKLEETSTVDTEKINRWIAELNKT